MQFTKTAAAVAAMFALCGVPSAVEAQSAQTTDRSGAITLQFTVAKWVEVVSDAPSTHNLTEGAEAIPGAGVIDTPDGMVTREIRANTPYRLSVVGVEEDSKIEFISGGNTPGSGILLDMECKTSATEMPASPTEYQQFHCSDSGPMEPTGSSWVTLRAYTDDPSATENRRAGLYQATVYLQIEAL